MSSTADTTVRRDDRPDAADGSDGRGGPGDTLAGPFAAALLDPDLPSPAGLRTWNGSDPARRLAVYRNNVVASLVDVLADTFEVTRRLVGEAFFRAMAAVFVRRHPPTSRVLATYGAALPDFIAEFAPAASLPYLPDVARLEFARVQACHAADADPMPAQTLQRLLASPDSLPGRHLHWHPSLRIVESRFAVVSLWSAHQTDGEMPVVTVDEPEQALVVRPALDVLVLPASRGATAFVAATMAGAPFGEAAEAAGRHAPDFDLAATLAGLLAVGALHDFL